MTSVQASLFHLQLHQSCLVTSCIPILLLHSQLQPMCYQLWPCIEYACLRHMVCVSLAAVSISYLNAVQRGSLGVSNLTLVHGIYTQLNRGMPASKVRMCCRSEPLRNHVRFSPMPTDPADWRAPHTSPSPRSSSPMHMELNTRPSSDDLIDNANPNLNGIDPARAKWAQKGTESQSCFISVASCVLPCDLHFYLLGKVVSEDHFSQHN